MTRYFLHIRDGDRYVEDPDGEEFETLDAARTEAVAAARDLLAESLRSGRVLDGQKVEICNEAGEIEAVVPFKDTFSVR